MKVFNLDLDSLCCINTKFDHQEVRKSHSHLNEGVNECVKNQNVNKPSKHLFVINAREKDKIM